MKDPQTIQKLSFFSELLHEVRAASYGHLFLHSGYVKLQQTSEDPRSRRRSLFTIFQEEDTATPSAKPTTRSSNKLTVSYSNQL
jgi:hypothetical protein